MYISMYLNEGFWLFSRIWTVRWIYVFYVVSFIILLLGWIMSWISIFSKCWIITFLKGGKVVDYPIPLTVSFGSCLKSGLLLLQIYKLIWTGDFLSYQIWGLHAEILNSYVLFFLVVDRWVIWIMLVFSEIGRRHIIWVYLCRLYDLGVEVFVDGCHWMTCACLDC